MPRSFPRKRQLAPPIDPRPDAGQTRGPMSRSLAGKNETPPARPRARRAGRLLAARRMMAGGAFALAMLMPALAHAELRLCNRTQSRIGVALGYKEGEGWTTEGWWNVSANSCETLVRGDLVARFYYLYAIDYDQGGEWSGKAFMCTREKEFTVRGDKDCLARGMERTGFFEVDTQEQKGWTIQLTETNQTFPTTAGSVPMPLPNAARAKTP